MMQQLASTLFFAALAGVAVAQPPIQPGYSPRPTDMDPHDSATMPSERDQISISTERANADRAAAAARSGGHARPATAAEIVAGSAVSDSTGVAIGTIESVGADGAVVASGTTRVRVPLDAFGINRHGLLLGITKAQFDDAAARAQ